MFCYVFFIKTGFEDLAAKEMGILWKLGDIKPFAPMYDRVMRIGGRRIIEKRRLFHKKDRQAQA
ncbi:MAG: hypothetical protein LBL83_04345 [Clostridiales bacterium]|jgi:hypothetical protein|nr:hypothetical protein [Clostridiales bacterium]